MTCVAETGRAAIDAAMTRAAVTTEAASPSSRSNSAMRSDMVCATRREKRIPPMTIAKATAVIEGATASTAPVTSSPTIFGVSFSARARQTAPEVK